MATPDRVTLSFVPTLSSILRRPPALLRPSIPTFRPSLRRSSPVHRFTHPLCSAAHPSAPAPAASSSSPSAQQQSATEPQGSDFPVAPTTPLNFQDALRRLTSYWTSTGCLVWHPYNVEVGAGTMNPATFLRVLGPEPWQVAYDEPSVRPDDSRYGDNPNRLQRHTQFQVILKPAPERAQELVVGSYHALGIDTRKHDVRFVEDNWESPVLGAWGLGWEIWLDGMEVTQFTYFQQAGGLTLDPVAVEVTYGLERIIMALQARTHFKDIAFTPSLSYGEIFMQNEYEMSCYNLDDADIARNKTFFELYETEALALIEKSLPIPAYNYILKASHTFNILDARGAIGVTERARYFQRMRNLAREVARLWVERREEIGFPLLKSGTDAEPTTSTGNPIATQSEQSDTSSSPVSTHTATANFVFEIGVEELPAGEVSEAMAQLFKLLTGVLTDARLSYSSLDVAGTPRRISAFVRDLETRQSDETKRVRGPPLRAALKDGKLTKAGTGFLRSQGATEADAEYDEVEGYMYATVHHVGRHTEEVLTEMLCPNVLARLTAPKSMRWNTSGVAYSRPIRWLLCLLDDAVVPLEYAGVTSGRITRSLRGGDGFSKDVDISSASTYHDTVRSLQIMLSREERAAKIREDSIRLAAEVGGIIPDEHLNGDLMDEVTDLVENPIPIVGSFDEEFLKLPDDVLITVMRKHQRYFPVVDVEGKMLNAFVTVGNGDSKYLDEAAVRVGNEAVLRARYTDAAFFYEKDSNNRKLSEFIPLLDGITFQEDLGSMLDKTNRVRGAINSIGTLLGLNADEISDATEIAALYKADLATAMVIEMTSLAGIMGRHYATKSGEATTSVCDGILEASLPRFSGDSLAKSKSGAVVAVADKMDSLVALFSVGLVPKSTADPYALRRAALGVVQTLVAQDLDVDCSKLISESAKALQAQSGTPVSDEIQKSVVEFIGKRLEAYLLDVVGVPDDVVKAVLAVSGNERNPVAAVTLCNTLQTLKTESPTTLAAAQEAHGRSARLLGSIKDVRLSEVAETGVDEKLFENDEESALWEALQKGRTTIQDDADGSYKQSLSKKVAFLAEIKPQVDAFFDGVFVNAEDKEVRRNRLALCVAIADISSSLCDLSGVILP